MKRSLPISPQRPQQRQKNDDGTSESKFPDPENAIVSRSNISSIRHIHHLYHPQAASSSSSSSSSKMPYHLRSNKHRNDFTSVIHPGLTTLPLTSSESSIQDNTLPSDIPKLPPSTPQQISVPSPMPSLSKGREAWRADCETYFEKWTEIGQLDGYVGLVATVLFFTLSDSDDSTSVDVGFEDIDGRSMELRFEMAFRGLDSYPHHYTVVIHSKEASRRARSAFERFTNIYCLDLRMLIEGIVCALQGDDEATGGNADSDDEAADLYNDEEDGMYGDDVEDGSLQSQIEGWHQPGRGLETAPGSWDDLGKDWTKLKEHFAQAVSLGYRPGLIHEVDCWLMSLSIPLKNLPVDPNTLMIWDEGLAASWAGDERLTLLTGFQHYPPLVDSAKYWLCLNKNYKPTPLVTRALMSGDKDTGFFLSASLLGYLKAFSRCYKIRTSFGVDWATADRVGLDEIMAREVLKSGQIPKGSTCENITEDPVGRGFESNIAVCAFYWVIRRFVNSPKFCLSCGLKVEIPSLRPYVCDKPLCLYGFMCLGLGPPLEHVIRNHPGVVDILLSFAYVAAQSPHKPRMDLPLNLGIEMCAEFHAMIQSTLNDSSSEVTLDYSSGEVTLYDSLREDLKRNALAWFIDKLPNVSVIKAFLEQGGTLNELVKEYNLPMGSLTVLRWVVGSCKAYIRETPPGEGVLNKTSDVKINAYRTELRHIRQFSFIVGNPEQEENFKSEIHAAQTSEGAGNVVRYPTLLAYHGSPVERWHNILRTGLDFQEIANARAFGDGVYCAKELHISLEYYSRSNNIHRSNADADINRAVALVELVNVPQTFVSKTPYYVVKNIKQIKPFRLLLATKQAPPTGPDATMARDPLVLFQHDPAEVPTWNNMPLQITMPVRLKPEFYVDEADYDPVDKSILVALALDVESVAMFEPSSKDRFQALQLLPPPKDTSSTASKTLGKELKAILDQQAVGGLPFYLDPGTESLYCWVLELYEFPDSQLKEDLKKLKLNSIIAELRFSAAFPHSPPFVRILHPRFLPFSHGGGGNITAGGSICHELLTATGWNVAYSVEAVVRDIMVNMVIATPPARIDMTNWNRAYSLSEAVEAFKRVAAVHSWEIPKDFDMVVSQSA